jgi:hypothetical protein
MSVQARRGDEVGEPLEQLKRCESELGAPVRCRTWESIDEAGVVGGQGSDSGGSLKGRRGPDPLASGPGAPVGHAVLGRVLEHSTL